MFLLSACNPSSTSTGEVNSPVGAEPAAFKGKAGDCQEFIDQLPSDYFKDWIEVPENPADPNGLKINVFYYGKIKDPNNVAIFYNGGPGADSHGNHKNFEEQMEKRDLTNKISFVYMDQRGNGCSDPYPQGSEPEVLKRLTHYGSRGIVNDSEFLRKHLLGNKPWKIFGQSYGAFIVHRYAILFPKSIVKAYGHANTLNASAEERHYFRISSQHRVLQIYLGIYPEDRERLQELNAQLTENFCVGPKDDLYCGTQIISEMTSWLGFSNRWPRMHSWLQSMVVDHQVQKDVLEDYYQKYIYEPPSGKGWASRVIGYWDRDVTSSHSSCVKIYDRLADLGISKDQLLLNECMDNIQFNYSNKSNEYVAQTLGPKRDLMTIQEFKNALSKMKPKTFYLYSGEKDSFVPKESFQEELAIVKDLLNYTHFENSGHEGFYTEDKVWADLTQ
jgi:hypothetical protein